MCTGSTKLCLQNYLFMWPQFLTGMQCFRTQKTTFLIMMDILSATDYYSSTGHSSTSKWPSKFTHSQSTVFISFIYPFLYPIWVAQRENKQGHMPSRAKNQVRFGRGHLIQTNLAMLCQTWEYLIIIYVQLAFGYLDGGTWQVFTILAKTAMKTKMHIQPVPITQTKYKVCLCPLNSYMIYCVIS